MSATLLDVEPLISHRAYTLWRRIDRLKVPVHYDGRTKHSTANPAPPLSANEARAWLSHHHSLGDTAVGFGFRPDGTGLVCVDLDESLTPEGQWTPGALAIMARLPGALVEQSVSGRGAHIWTNAPAAAPLIARRGQVITPHGKLEMYANGQFVAAGKVLGGDARVDHSAALLRMLEEFWPPVAEAGPVGQVQAWGELPVAERATKIEHLRSALAVLDPDDRETWVSVGQALRSAGEDGHALWTEWSATSHRFPGGDGLDKWDTFSGERTDYRAVFAKAAATKNWDNPATRPDPTLRPAGEHFPTAAQLPAGAVAERPETVPPAMSDDALALQFVEQGDEFLRSPGLGWMVNNGQTWVQDAGLKRFNRARTLCREAAASIGLSGTERKRLASAKTVNAVLTMAQSDPRIGVADDEWDADPMIVNTPEGIVDLRTGRLRARGRNDRVTMVTRVSPVASACPTFQQFLVAVFLGDLEMIEFAQRTMGYWLTGDRREQSVHFLYGLGANGKSVLMDLVQWIGGSYVHKLPAGALMASKGDRHPTELAQLRGKRLAISSEVDEGAFFNEALLKELTGDATLTARFMRGDPFQFTMSQKHVIVGNHKPRLRGGDEAMARRMLLVPFQASFKGAARDPHMLGKLKVEAPAILAWMVEGAKKWNDGGLMVPGSVRTASAEYMNDHDDLALWVEEKCDMHGEARANELYASFSTWKQARGEHPPSITVWGARLTSLPGIAKRKSSGIRYAGISLRQPQVGTVGTVPPLSGLPHLNTK